MCFALSLFSEQLRLPELLQPKRWMDQEAREGSHSGERQHKLQLEGAAFPRTNPYREAKLFCVLLLKGCHTQDTQRVPVFIAAQENEYVSELKADKEKILISTVRRLSSFGHSINTLFFFYPQDTQVFTFATGLYR